MKQQLPAGTAAPVLSSAKMFLTAGVARYAELTGYQRRAYLCMKACIYFKRRCFLIVSQPLTVGCGDHMGLLLWSHPLRDTLYSLFILCSQFSMELTMPKVLPIYSPCFVIPFACALAWEVIFLPRFRGQS